MDPAGLSNSDPFKTKGFPRKAGLDPLVDLLNSK